MSTTAYQALRHDGAADAPLVFAFHGTGGDETQFFDLVRQMLPEASVISPRGDVLEMGAARFFRRTGEAVYDMQDLVSRTSQMAEFIAAQQTDKRRVYGFGYSNGANILASVLFKHSSLFDRVGLLHPLVPWVPEPVNLSGKQVLISAGERDPICPWPESARLIEWFQTNGADVTTEIHAGGHELRNSEIDALRKVFS